MDLNSQKSSTWNYHPFSDFESECGFVAFSSEEQLGHIFTVKSLDSTVEEDFELILSLLDDGTDLSERTLFEKFDARGELHELRADSLSQLIERYAALAQHLKLCG